MGYVVDSGETRFKLLRYFTIGSLIAFIVAAALLGFVFRKLAVEGLLSGYQNEHVNHARIIANEMWERDLAPLASAHRATSWQPSCKPTSYTARY